MKRLLIVCCCLVGTATFAQVPVVKNCATMEQDSINRIKYPEMGQHSDFEDAVRRKLNEIAIRNKNGRTQATLLTIPVIVHVVHAGEAVGSGRNLSKAQIEAQLEVLNEDFRRKSGTPGFNDNAVGADIEIEFCLSPVDEDGNALPEPGIERIRGANTTWTRAQIEGSLKPSTIWNPNLFYNIWTLEFGGEDTNLLGYAQFPDQSGLSGLNQTGGPASTDGVVVMYSSFGSVDKGTFPVMRAPYNRGRTLVHETGHWLGLRHIWGDGPCANDFVDDTPTHQSENRGCPATKLSCDNVSLQMPQNYMDYSDDACMNIFTIGQKSRMRAVMELSPRRRVLAQANLCNSSVDAPPVASFTSDKQTILRGGEVVFTDLSSNFPNKWNWTFEGGDPSTSNVQNPRVKYSTPGTFRVTLISTNALGNSAPETKGGFITVSEEGLCGSVSNYKADYTPTLLKLKDFGPSASTGYLTGHNSAKIKAASELFSNPQGYSYISGVKIKFGRVYTTKDDASVTVTVWNARGVQNGPGSVIERKTVLLKQIKTDVAAGQATSITFDRETPVFSRAYHVGVEFTYSGDSLAIESSANGEATNSSSWVQASGGKWEPYSIAYGASLAMNIEPIVGMNPSVQVSSSKLYINPGEEVILNAKGASIFVWSSSDNVIKNIPGPQLVVRPIVTTVYETKGSGLDLCNQSAFTTIFVKDGPVTGVEETLATPLSLYPNPGSGTLNVSFESTYRGAVVVQVRTLLNQPVHEAGFSKSNERFDASIDTSNFSPGIYITAVTIGGSTVYGKWVKR